MLDKTDQPYVPTRYRIRDIQCVVSDFFHVELIDILSDRHCPEFVYPRHVAMYVAKVATLHSFPTIGRFFRRDHTTVLHAIRKMKKVMAEGGSRARQINHLLSLFPVAEYPPDDA